MAQEATLSRQAATFESLRTRAGPIWVAIGTGLTPYHVALSWAEPAFTSAQGDPSGGG